MLPARLPAADHHGISSAYYLPQEFVDNSLHAFQRLPLHAFLPLPQLPQILLLHCLPTAAAEHNMMRCIMVMDNACGMNHAQLSTFLVIAGNEASSGQVRKPGLHGRVMPCTRLQQ